MGLPGETEGYRETPKVAGKICLHKAAEENEG